MDLNTGLSLEMFDSVIECDCHSYKQLNCVWTT